MLLWKKKSHESTRYLHENAKILLSYYNRASESFCSVGKFLVPKKRFDKHFLPIEHIYRETFLKNKKPFRLLQAH